MRDNYGTLRLRPQDAGPSGDLLSPVICGTATPHQTSLNRRLNPLRDPDAPD